MVTAENLIRRSTRAKCGAFEREVSVRPENLLKAKVALRQKGFQIVLIFLVFSLVLSSLLIFSSLPF